MSSAAVPSASGPAGIGRDVVEPELDGGAPVRARQPGQACLERREGDVLQADPAGVPGGSQLVELRQQRQRAGARLVPAWCVGDLDVPDEIQVPSERCGLVSTVAAAAAAVARRMAASSSCSAGATPSTRLPYRTLKAVVPSCAAMPTATSGLSRSSRSRPGRDSSPRSPAAMSPDARFMATRCTPASRTAATRRSTSWSVGVVVANGHQSSTASNPAACAAAGRASSSTSGRRIEQLAR